MAFMAEEDDEYVHVDEEVLLDVFELIGEAWEECVDIEEEDLTNAIIQAGLEVYDSVLSGHNVRIYVPLWRRRFLWPTGSGTTYTLTVENVLAENALASPLKVPVPEDQVRRHAGDVHKAVWERLLRFGQTMQLDQVDTFNRLARVGCLVLLAKQRRGKIKVRPV